MKIGLIPYSYYSESCMKLNNSLPYSVSYNKPNDVLINFGSTQKFSMSTKIYVNHPMNVKVACNKLKTFNKLKGKVNIPNFTDNIYEASKSLKYPIFIRKTLTGSQGKGIVIANEHKELFVAPLYVEHIKNSREHRVIVVGNKVVAHMQKYKRDILADDEMIQNLDSGYRYSYEIAASTDKISCRVEAVKAIRVLGLQFGAVDIIMDEKGTAYVLEVNTAFGLGRRNVEKVSNALIELASKLGFVDRVTTYIKNIVWGIIR